MKIPTGAETSKSTGISMTTKLRNGGIYQLPNAQRSVFAMAIGDEFYLYDTAFGARLPPRYIVHTDGKLINWFNDFPSWTIEDLVDTGETYGEKISPE